MKKRKEDEMIYIEREKAIKAIINLHLRRKTTGRVLGAILGITAFWDLNKERGWIPCDERMPEMDGMALIWFEYDEPKTQRRVGEIKTSFVYKGTWWTGFIGNPDNYPNFKIVAWMPMPDPYREEE